MTHIESFLQENAGQLGRCRRLILRAERWPQTGFVHLHRSGRGGHVHGIAIDLGLCDSKGILTELGEAVWEHWTQQKQDLIDNRWPAAAPNPKAAEPLEIPPESLEKIMKLVRGE